MKHVSKIFNGFICGLFAGLFVALLEALFLPEASSTIKVICIITALIVAFFTWAGAAFGLFIVLIQLSVQTLLQTVGSLHREKSTAALVVGAISFPFVYWLISQLAQGHQASQILGPIWIRLLITIGLVCFLGLVIWVGQYVFVRIFQKRQRKIAIYWGVVFFVFAFGIFWADARLYRRLYQDVHFVLFFAYFVFAWISSFCLISAFYNFVLPRHSWMGKATCLLLAAVFFAGWWAHWNVARDQQKRFVILEESTASTKVLLFAPLPKEPELPLFLDTPRVSISQKTSSIRIPNANIVLVSVDALRADHLGAYGYSRLTSPNIDALAKRGVVFEHAYCQVPLTCYSVPSLFTGDFLKSTLEFLPKPPMTLAKILAASDYKTAAFYNESIFFCDDKRATHYGDTKFGFQYAQTELFSADRLTDNVISYLKDFILSEKKKLFLWVHYFDCHEPYRKEAGFDFGDKDIDRYDAEIAYVDKSIGRLVAALGQVKGPTIFIITADHGEEFREHGGNFHGSSLYDEQIRVPLIIAAPGLHPFVSKDPVQLVDVVPTILSLLRLSIPDSVHGTSLVLQMLGQKDPKRSAFSEVHTKKMIRVGNWKLIHDFRRSTYELYNLSRDPKERQNLINQHPNEAVRLKASLFDWFDGLRAIASQHEVDRPMEIELGKLGDRRAGPMLAKLVTNVESSSQWRTEAARLLGQLQDRSTADSLWLAAIDDDSAVADEAAIALGEMKDLRARLLLPRVLKRRNPDVRLRAAIALARVDGKKSIPALIEALYTNDWELQNRAAHYLGFIGDERAVEPLIKASMQFQLRGRVAVALGRLGQRHPNPKILKFLLDLFLRDSHLDVRQNALAGLAFLNDRKAIPFLVEKLGKETELTWLPKTLTYLGAVGSFLVPGLDFSPGQKGLIKGWGKCFDNRSVFLENLLGQTWCRIFENIAIAEFKGWRNFKKPHLLFHIRPLHLHSVNASLVLTINKHQLSPIRIEQGWKSYQLAIPNHFLRPGINSVQFSLKGDLVWLKENMAKGLMDVDYLVVADPESLN